MRFMNSYHSFFFLIISLFVFKGIEPALAACPGTVSSDTTVSDSNANCSTTWNGGDLTFTSSGAIVNDSTTAITLSGSTVGTLQNAGEIDGGDDTRLTAGSYSGNGLEATDSTITAIDNSGLFQGGRQGIVLYGSNIGSITNSGTIMGFFSAVELSSSAAGSNVTTLTNTASGTIEGISVEYDSVLGTLENAGAITRYSDTLSMYDGTITNLNNTGSITSTNGSPIYMTGASVITNLVNDGSISGKSYGFYIDDTSQISSFINNGTITSSSSYYGVTLFSSAQIGTLTNNGTMTCASCAVIDLYNSARIGTVTNNGTLSGGVGIEMYGSSNVLNLLVNTGTITGTNYSIYSKGTITNAIQNDGSLIGKIYALKDMEFTGGSSSTYGLISGDSIQVPNLTFASAAFQTLSSDVNLGSGTLTNNGHLKLVGSQSLTGNFVQASSGVLDIGVTNISNYGNLTVTGNATMTNSLVNLSALSGGDLTAGASYVVVKADGTVDYSGVTATATGYSDVSVSTNTNGSFEELIITLGAYTGGGGGAGGAGGSGSSSEYERIGSIVDPVNSKTTGAVLDQLHAAGVTDFNSLFTTLDNLGAVSETAESSAIRSLGPSELTPQLMSTGYTAAQAGQMVSQHQSALVAKMDSGQSVGMAAGSDYQKGIFWGQLSGGNAHKDKSATVGGYDSSYFGLTTGVDLELAEDTVIGGAFSWMQNKAYGSGSLSGLDTSSNSYQLSLYSSNRFYKHGFMNALVGFGFNNFDQSRYISALGQTARADYNGIQYMGKVNLGWDMKWSDTFTITPLAGLEVIRAENNSYTETGAGVANVSVDRQIINNIASTVGFKIASEHNTSWAKISPEMEFAWVHDYESGPVITNASMGGIKFQTSAPRADKNGAQLVIGAVFKQNDDLSIRVQYNGDYRSDYISHSGLMKVKYAF